MKGASFNIIYCILFIIITPILVYLYCQRNNEIQSSNKMIISVFDKTSNKTISMPFEEYVWRATAKEVPVSFEDEAIKAQSIAIRTYAYRKLGKILPEHNGADVCSDFNHCTAFLMPGTEKSTYGKYAKNICKKYETLSNSTNNIILTYKNEPILAAFHSISSGITEKSSDVWVNQLPYLINVESEFDKNVDGYLSQVDFKYQELKKLFPTNNNDSIYIISRTNGGSVNEINIFGINYSGSEVRKKLNLRSANFTIEKKDDIFRFNVFGYGHGVGMSQNGANEYAKSGFSYEKILYKYYPGTNLVTIDKLNRKD